MKAGRELDLRVARIVFGVKNFYHNEQDTIWFFVGKDKQLLPFYSTNIADAWKVVEKAETFELNKYVNGEFDAEITLSDEIIPKDAESNWGSAEDTSLPLAICIAALKAYDARP